MAASFKLGSFVARTGTGTQAVTGVGFQPKGLYIWSQLPTGAFLTSFEYSNHGIADSVIHQYGGSSAENDQPAATSDVNSAENSGTIIYGYSYTNTPEMVATLSSMDSDGFTLTWLTNAFGNTCEFNYIAIGGGSDVSVFAGSFTGPSGGSLPVQAVTGVGFQPDVLLGFHTHAAIFNDSRMSFGWCDNAMRQGVCLTNAKNGQNPSKTRCLQRDDGMFALIDSGTDAVTALVRVTSFDADGFTVNWDVQPAATNPIYFLAIKGVRAYAGTFNQKTSTGNQSVTGVGFTPLAVLFQSIGVASPSTSLQNGMRWTRSAMTGGAQISAWCGSENNVSPVSSTRAGSRVKAIQLYLERATLKAEATRSSLDSGGFTLNWGTADATARTIQFLALAGAITVTAINPTRGTIEGGTAVTITGTGFSSFAGTPPVALGGAACTSVNVVNDTTITAVTAAHAKGLVDLVVDG